ncbi:MAG: hypothetical protein GC131_07190 [Alphaproteobacteria bacterium]|nr:hypothetical protein [Alphaproteobacteria bacterium]
MQNTAHPGITGKQALFFFLCFAVALLSFLRAPFSEFITPLASHPWFMTYEHGFLRRGLIGTIAAALTDSSVSMGGVVRNACAVFDGLFIVLAAGMLAWAQRILDRTSFLLAAGYILVTPLLPYQAHQTGFVDVIVLCITTLAFICLLRKQAAAFVALFAIGMLVHEVIGLILLPVAALSAYNGGKSARMTLAATLVIFAGVILAASQNPISPAMIDEMKQTGRPSVLINEEIFGEMKTYLDTKRPGADNTAYINTMISPDHYDAATSYLNQSSLTNLKMNLLWWREYPLRALAGVFYPAFAILPLLLYWCFASNLTGQKLVMVVAMLGFPYASLLLSFDTSRMMSVAGFANFLFVIAFTHLRTEPRPAIAFAPLAKPIAITLFAFSFLLYWAAPILWVSPSRVAFINLYYHALIHNPVTKPAHELAQNM